jgi:hypothetical protein
MQLRKIFEFQIDRPIEGVIKADDDASLRTEVEEYVISFQNSLNGQHQNLGQSRRQRTTSHRRLNSLNGRPPSNSLASVI